MFYSHRKSSLFFVLPAKTFFACSRYESVKESGRVKHDAIYISRPPFVAVPNGRPLLAVIAMVHPVAVLLREI